MESITEPLKMYCAHQIKGTKLVICAIYLNSFMPSSDKVPKGHWLEYSLRHDLWVEMRNSYV